MDAFRILTTFAQEHPDFSAADRLEESARYVQRQRAIARCLDGQEHPDVLLDMLAEQGIEPAEYVAEVGQGVELVIAQGIPLVWE